MSSDIKIGYSTLLCKYKIRLLHIIVKAIDRNMEMWIDGRKVRN